MQQSNYNQFDVSKRPVWQKSLITISLLCVANFIKYLLRDYIGHSTPFLLYFGFIMLCGRFIGFWYAIASTLVFAIIATIYFLIPYKGFTLAAFLKIGIYLLEGYFIAALANGLRQRLEALQISEVNFSTLISKSKDGLAKFAANGNIIYMSPSIESITGMSRLALASNNFNIFRSENDRKLVAEKFLEVVSHPGKSTVVIHPYLNQEKISRWMETIFTNCLNVPGVNAVVANYRDVTERVEADIRKSDFIGVISHEVKNPLTVIQFIAEMQNVSLDQNDMEQLRQSNALLKTSAQKMAVLLNDLLNYAGFEASLLNLRITPVVISEIINSVLVNFCAMHSNAVLVSGDVSVTAYMDAARVEQVMLNLLANAAKYSPSGSDIRLHCVLAADVLTMEIVDQGNGIPLHEQDNLFNKFYRVPGEHEVKGFGLGLYICAKIVKAHNGKIGVKSKPGEGSLFWFSIPVLYPQKSP